MGENETLFIRPVFDKVTEVLNDKIVPDIVDYARRKAYMIIDLYGEKANKSELLSMLLRYQPMIVFAGSHGLQEEVIGPEAGVTVIDIGNTVWFYRRIVIINACLTGRKLAPALVDAGANAVLAYDDELVIRVYADTYEPVEGFKECLTKAKVLYDGVTVKEAHEKTIEEYNKWIDYWEERDPVTADVLRHDRDHFKLYGTGESRIALSINLFIGLTDVFTLVSVILWSILQVVRGIRPLLRT